ncbi:hypothetical protein KL864_33700 [Mycolicibacterium goodii]|uniref:hypothetical protein n=1 Tax=Mycolicibacterium goodii TaxID=134601 RepID=UPI001BDCE436|nr:hypothetical protein [Mycolicibacterium goodii]MBU8820821.1 hypothetical protein [Mycolicibacterium goodii]
MTTTEIMGAPAWFPATGTNKKESDEPMGSQHLGREEAVCKAASGRNVFVANAIRGTNAPGDQPADEARLDRNAIRVRLAVT